MLLKQFGGLIGLLVALLVLYVVVDATKDTPKPVQQAEKKSTDAPRENALATLKQAFGSPEKK